LNYDAGMYLDALEFLDEEREAWRPYEALAELSDAALVQPLDAISGWSGRDLMGHLVAWQEVVLATAKELAVREDSGTKARADADWEAEGGDVINERLVREWAAVPMAELRQRFATVPGELRGYLTVVPESRWLKHAANLEFIETETIEHYAEHRADLEAVLEAAR
jgi:hypothetical protein